MATVSTTSTDKHITALKKILEQSSPAEFESLAAHLFSQLIDGVGVSVSKPGSQFGGDAGTAGLRGRRLRVECKRYRESTRLNPRELAGEVMEAVVKDKYLEAWVLVATKKVSETERNLARDVGSTLGVPIVVIDWTPPPSGTGINQLAALCASWPDVVESHIGKVAADEARALQPYVGDTIINFTKDLETWNIGFEHLRKAALNHLKSIWKDSAASKAAINQDASGGRAGVHLIERVTPLQQLTEWWLKPSDIRSPAVVTGIEGVGKTWVSLDWVNRNVGSMPIVVLVGSNEFINGYYLSEGGVRDLLTRAMQALAKPGMSDEYWRQRVSRLLERPAADGAAFLIIVDGLNQQPHVNWTALGQSLQGPAYAGKVRMLTTVRQHNFETDLKKLSKLQIAPTQVQVGFYSPSELDELLQLHGMSRNQLHPKLVSLASTPRLFPLVVRLKDNLALQSEATVSRLLFEYGKDVMQLRQSSAFTDEEWVAWLVERATDYRQRMQAGLPAQAATAKELSATLAKAHLSPAEIARRLSDVIDGRMVTSTITPTGTRHALEEQSALLGLSLAMLDSLFLFGSASFDAIHNELQTWLEPVAAIDQVSDVLRAALAVLSALPGNDGTSITDVLLTTWMNVQNPTTEFANDVAALGCSFPRSMLCVVEQSTLRSRAAAFHFAVQSLRVLPRKRTDEWNAITKRMLTWASFINLPQPEHLADPNHYAKSHQAELLNRIGNVTPGSLVVLGETLNLDYSHPGDPAVAIPGILEGHCLIDFLMIFRRAAVREAVQVDHRGNCWAGLKWLVLLANDCEVKTRATIAKLADELLFTTPEKGVHERLQNRASALLLRLTGEEANEKRAGLIDETFGNRWNYNKDYLQKPATSYFALEHRHLQQVLQDTAVSTHKRLDRLGIFLPDPAVNLPAELIVVIVDAMKMQTFDEIDVNGQTTINEHQYEKRELLGARFAPQEFVAMTRRRLKALASRDGESKYWAALAASELVLASTSSDGLAFAGLRNRSQLGSQEQHANTWCLQLELLHLPVLEQLETLKDVKDFYFTTDLMSVIRPASAEQLLMFVRRNEAVRQTAAKVALQVMAYQRTENANELAEELVEYLNSSQEDIRAIAFVALVACAPQICGHALMAQSWKPDDDDPFIAHHGSYAVAKVTKQIPFAELFTIVAPWRWLDAAMIRGAVPNELDEASCKFLAIFSAPLSTLPDLQMALSVGVTAPKEIGRISVQEKPTPAGEGGFKAFMRLAEDSETVNRRMQELAQEAASAIQNLRSSGHQFYLHSFSHDSVLASYKTSPVAWMRMLDGMDMSSPEFINRLHSAEGLYLSLCETLLGEAPSKGAVLWRALRDNLRTRFHGLAGVDELHHIPFRAAPTAEVLALREEAASIKFCNTDKHLFDLVIAAQVNGQEAWLQNFVANDRASNVLWRQKRAIVMAAFSASLDLSNLRWPQGEKTSSWETLTDQMRIWSNRAVFAKYWWQKFLDANDANEAYGAWVVFLSCADRRAYVWIEKLTYATNRGSELDRLRGILLRLTNHVLKRHLKKPEDKSPGLADHLFGQDAPSTWLTLDGMKY